MEDRVLSELEKHKEELEKRLKDKFGVKQEVVEEVSDILYEVLTKMIQLMREGKSAHEKFFSDIILNSVDAIIGIDNNLRIFLWNKGAEDIFGYTKDEATGEDFSFLIPEYLLAKGEREYLINEVTEKGFLANHETERLAKGGRILNVSLSRFAVYNEEKQMIGSVGIIRDMTKVKKLEKELREKENLALIGEVVSSIAHSISNPLNIISGNADYLLLDREASDKDFEELKTILDETGRITKSIRHLLNFSRPIHVKKDKNDLNKIVKNVVRNSRYIIGEKNIDVAKVLDDTLTEFQFDKEEIEEVIMNIFTNSVQAIYSSGEIKIKTINEGKFASVEITDSGPGIVKENLTKIFLPFFSSKEFGKGTGLGLPIAKRIINEHGGEISVKSAVGKGTTFRFTLPL